LLTVIGAGGAGKTRRALQLASHLEEVCLVELAPLADPTLVDQAVATALELPQEHDRPALESVIVFGSSPEQARKAADTVALNVFHNVAFYAGPVDDLLAAAAGASLAR
jgi:hypothetical protein